jgi:DnaK suppressor protein
MADYKQMLLDKERELLERTARLKGEARNTVPAEVGDYADVATADSGASEVIGVEEMESEILVQVQDALRRIEDGTYGKCVDCGRPIPEARLQAVPWTPYCQEHQELHDRNLRI